MCLFGLQIAKTNCTGSYLPVKWAVLILELSCKCRMTHVASEPTFLATGAVTRSMTPNMTHHDANFCMTSLTRGYCFQCNPARRGVTKGITFYQLWHYYYMYRVLVHILRVPTPTERELNNFRLRRYNTMRYNALHFINTQRFISRAKERRQ